jgi:hypothetical protein
MGYITKRSMKTRYKVGIRRVLRSFVPNVPNNVLRKLAPVALLTWSHSTHLCGVVTIALRGYIFQILNAIIMAHAIFVINHHPARTYTYESFRNQLVNTLDEVFLPFAQTYNRITRIIAGKAQQPPRTSTPRATNALYAPMIRDNKFRFMSFDWFPFFIGKRFDGRQFNGLRSSVSLFALLTVASQPVLIFLVGVESLGRFIFAAFSTELGYIVGGHDVNLLERFRCGKARQAVSAACRAVSILPHRLIFMG